VRKIVRVLLSGFDFPKERLVADEFIGGIGARSQKFTHISEAAEILTNVRVLMILVNV